MASTPLPPPKAVKDLFTDLVGKEVGVGTGKPVLVTPVSDTYIGVFTTDRMQTGAIIVMDLALAGYLGGALGLLPAKSIQDAVDRRMLPQLAVDNIGEVYNIAASIFNVPGARHVRMYQVIGPEEPAPLDVLALANALGRRMDLDVEVPGYGTGRLSVVLSPN